jgi:hypothetical protein
MKAVVGTLDPDEDEKGQGVDLNGRSDEQE